MECEILVISRRGRLVTTTSAVEEAGDVVIASSGPVSRGGSNGVRHAPHHGWASTARRNQTIFQDLRVNSSTREKWWLVYNESGNAMNWLRTRWSPTASPPSSRTTSATAAPTGGTAARSTLNVSTPSSPRAQAAGASQQIVVEALTEEIEAAARSSSAPPPYSSTAGDSTGPSPAAWPARRRITATRPRGVVLAAATLAGQDMVAKFLPRAAPSHGGVYDSSGLKLALWIGVWRNTRRTPHAAAATKCCPAAGGRKARSPRSPACW
ncbi:MAG: hypothetical protein ACLT98_10835 [Eggerthellaceae bacterium]